MKFRAAIKSAGGVAPSLIKKANTRAAKLAALPSGTVIARREVRQFKGTAETLDQLIAELIKARDALGGDASWAGWDDEQLYLTTRSGVRGEGYIIHP